MEQVKNLPEGKEMEELKEQVTSYTLYVKKEWKGSFSYFCGFFKETYFCVCVHVSVDSWVLQWSSQGNLCSESNLWKLVLLSILCVPWLEHRLLGWQGSLPSESFSFLLLKSTMTTGQNEIHLQAVSQF